MKDLRTTLEKIIDSLYFPLVEQKIKKYQFMFCDNYCDNIAQYGNNVTLFIFVDIYKRVFSKLLESTNSLKNKKILLLVHPDIVFETTTSFAQLYLKTLDYNLTRFDYVITHLFFSEKAYDYLKWDDLTVHLYKHFIKMLKERSDFIAKDKDYSISFDTALGDYLLSNPGSTVYFGGGYKDNCVRITQETLENRFGWLLKDTETTLACYPELLISSRHKPSLG